MAGDVYEAKRAFVRDHLGPTLRAATRGAVQALVYRREGPREWVAAYVGGRAEPVRVNVSCDSEWALMRDVLRGVGEFV